MDTDNVIPFPTPEPPPRGLQDILLNQIDLEKCGGPLRLVWSLIEADEFSPHAAKFLIGCLALEIAALKGEKLWYSRYFD